MGNEPGVTQVLLKAGSDDTDWGQWWVRSPIRHGTQAGRFQASCYSVFQGLLVKSRFDKEVHRDGPGTSRGLWSVV